MNGFFQNHIALFGGSFNPPHLGHLVAARGLLQNPGVKKVLVLPSFGNPLKPESSVSFEKRFEMAKLNFEELEVSSFEKVQMTNSTSELLSQIKLLTAEHPDAFIIGTDQFNSLASWVDFPNFLLLCDWIVLLRQPHPVDSCASAIRKYESLGILRSTRDPQTFEIKKGPHLRHLRLVETDAQEVSSTFIREQLALRKKDKIKHLLKPEVLDYIERNSLYGT